jgi:hypothetical protein
MTPPPDDLELCHDRLYHILSDLVLIRQAVADRAAARSHNEAARLRDPGPQADEHTIGPTTRPGSVALAGVAQQLNTATDLLDAAADLLGGWEDVYGTELYYGPDGRGYEYFYDWTRLPGGPWHW